MKCNVDKASKGCPKISICEGIFRDRNTNFPDGFFESFRIANVFQDEIKCGVICVLYNLFLANIGRIYGLNVAPP